ncbi:kinase-like domain-containing protein [Sporodiniella umbellata]|nr:kinase-like domain-containing protein [Sporodiniella umbellata]
MSQLVTTYKTQNPLENKMIGKDYRVGKKIGEGSFGVIHEGIHLRHQAAVAMKFESLGCEVPQLKDEYKVYMLLSGTEGIPNVYYYGEEATHRVLIMDILGPSLEDMFDVCERRFSVKTVALLALKMISILESVHNKGLLFRDIKPDNFLLGRPGSENENRLYLIDFGMAKLYKHPKTQQHICYKEGKSLTGTARYMSIHTHLGKEQSRRDDLEALGHVLMYFLRGNLPWQGLKAADHKEKYSKIGETKRDVSISSLCEGYPRAFAEYLTLVRELEFAEDPDYAWFKSLFSSCLGNDQEEVFDWCLLSDSDRWRLLSPEERKRWIRKKRHQLINKGKTPLNTA